MPSLKFQNLPTSCLGREFFGKKQKFPFFKRTVAAARDDSRIFLKMEKTFFKKPRSFSFIDCTVDAWGQFEYDPSKENHIAARTSFSFYDKIPTSTRILTF